MNLPISDGFLVFLGNENNEDYYDVADQSERADDREDDSESDVRAVVGIRAVVSSKVDSFHFVHFQIQ